MIGALLLVLLDATIELVAQCIDRSVHIRLGRIRMDVASPYVQGGLGLLPQLLDGENTVHVDHLVEMARDALEKLLLDIAPEGRGDFDMVTREVEPHMPSPLGGLCVTSLGNLLCDAHWKERSRGSRDTWRSYDERLE